MINPIFAQFQNEVWMMEPKKLAAMFTQFSQVDPQGIANLMAIKIDRPKSIMQIENGVAVINIHGVLMKNPPQWLSWFGIEAADYIEIQNQLAQALGNDSVKSILLHTNSPGGTVAGASETADAIFAANKIKPVTAYVEDLAASAAIYLISQSGKIEANPNAIVGSIGVLVVYEDYSKAAEMAGVKVHVIRSGEYKGMGVVGAEITEKQIQSMQEVINGMAANFKSAVSRGRKMSSEAVDKIATGQTWIACDAKKLNLVDEIINGINSQSKQNSNMKGQDMPDSKSEQQIQQEATAAEIKRMKDIQAAIPDDAAFCLEQYQKGASAVEAKAAYADKLKEKNAALSKENQELQAKNKTQKPEGADPIKTEDDGDGQQAAGGTADFMAMAKEYAKTNKVSIKDAMKHVNSENPESHQAYLEKCGQAKVKIGGKAKRVSKE